MPLLRSIPPKRNLYIAIGTVALLVLYAVLRLVFEFSPEKARPALFAIFIFGGVPLIWDLLKDLFNRKFGSDLLAGISICVSVILGEYLAGSIVILMLSGGEALEGYALNQASSVLRELSKRIPSHAHRRTPGSEPQLIQTGEIEVGDELIILPHEICPVDGTVIEGHGHMDESYLTGEPYEISKAPGSYVISGAVNGSHSITIKAVRPFRDSRYAQIIKVFEDTELNKPRIRRLGDQLGAWYTPFCLAVAAAAWAWSGSATRFLAVLVVATPCPLIIGIPVAVIGAISLAAKRGIIIRNPGALEVLSQCRTIILDKTGTLTTGRPLLTEQIVRPGVDRLKILQLAASLERYSKHPLAEAVIQAARKENLQLKEARSLSEEPGRGLNGVVGDFTVGVTSRKRLAKEKPLSLSELPPVAPGLECVITVNGEYAATYRFRDVARSGSRSFIAHLGKKHQVDRIMLVSGDREPEVRYLAKQVGIHEIYAEQQPEDKVRIVRAQMEKSNVIFIGDGINDAPALNLATVGIAFGQGSEVTLSAADAVIMDSTLEKVDEFFHIGLRMKRIALQSALGGMILSVGGMGFAAFGYLTPLAGALLQEGIDIAAVLNALRTAFKPSYLTDYRSP
ncbi:MAG: heavy metal translocating P-type ATPase [Deltaproteobacteria bacterium]|nr:heavy metal translocating P-type ATPase [Deltaproteobacteria bacterium]